MKLLYYYILILYYIQFCEAKSFTVPRYFKNNEGDIDTSGIDYLQNNGTLGESPMVSLLDPLLNPNDNSSPFTSHTFQRWKVGKINRKQYEVINMIWRKKQLFADDNGNVFDPLNDTSIPLATIPQTYLPKLVMTKPSPPASTISYIEFYYFDEIIEPVPKAPDRTFNYISNRKHDIASPGIPLLSFDLNKPIQGKIESFELFRNLFEKRVPNYHFTNKPTSLLTLEIDKEEKESKSTTSNFLQSLLKNMSLSAIHLQVTKDNAIPTFNDRIRFFEIYDTRTQGPLLKSKEYATVDYDKNLSSANIKISLENVDTDLKGDPGGLRHVRRTSEGDINLDVTKQNVIEDIINTPVASTTTVDTTTYKTAVYDNYSSDPESSIWENYPFIAVYVYDRFQVHCDAAAINSYWLIASASCLSRHQAEPHGEDRSAFVSYCGNNWWKPERITYVKLAKVHPRYHPKYSARKHQYNIGVIQVITSMSSTCSNWAPVTIMSYHYVAEPSGSIATAVGWGLDRYDSSFASTDLPKRLLSVYNNVIYSDSCPGNSDYRLAKEESPEATANTYCLTLPSYKGEDKDPVHGGLLMIGGKLIALYLQEERRKIGEQSAQYTGVWKLLPWVYRVAQEPEVTHFFV